MVGTGEALLNVRTRGGSTADAKGAATVPTSQEFDFQSELRKFDKVRCCNVSIAGHLAVFIRISKHRFVGCFKCV